MTIIFGSGRYRYWARVSILLIMATLIAGIAGCADNGGESYTLTITSTTGGSVVEPGEGTFTYNEGTVVNLVAEADEGYRFLNWSGVLIHIANRKAAVTTIVMDKDYSISANFAIPTLVWDWYDLNATRDDLYGIYILMNDLNSTTPGYEELAGPTANGGKGWQPIGSSNETQFDVFHGTLDGAGYEICDLFINRPDTYDVGLLSVIWLGGGITNLGVVNATVTGYAWVGGLAAGSIGFVDNSYCVASVNGTAHVGGLVGTNGVEGILTNCHFIGNVTGDWSVGGLSGTTGSIVSDCYSIGSVTGNERVGGLVGYNSGIVSNSYATGTVSVNGTIAGGLVGKNDGGWAVRDWGTVTNSYSTASVAGQADIGGLIGSNWGNVSNSYSSGNVAGYGLVGGLVGTHYEGTVTNCYSTGTVTGNYSSVGGLVGDRSYGAVSNCFWDTETSGQSISAGGIGKTTTEMQDIITFSAVDWNIIAVGGSDVRNPAYIWNIVDDVTYPFLSWQP